MNNFVRNVDVDGVMGNGGSLGWSTWKRGLEDSRDGPIRADRLTASPDEF